MDTRRFVMLLRAAEAALWEDNRDVWEGIAHEVGALRYGLPPQDCEAVAAAIRERLWQRLSYIATARRPDRLARALAYQAANEAARELLPEAERLRLHDDGTQHDAQC